MALLPRVTIRADQTGRIFSAVDQAAIRALNRAIASVRTDATRRLAQEMGLRAKTVRDRLKIIPAKNGQLEATLVVGGKRIPIKEFAARQTRQGVTYRGPGGARTLIKSAFIAKMRSGHIGVFERRTTKRLPIVERFGASLPFVAVKQKILQAGLAVGEAAFRKNLEHELGRALGVQNAATSVRRPA